MFCPNPSYFNSNRANVWNWTRTCSILNWSSRLFFLFGLHICGLQWKETILDLCKKSLHPFSVVLDVCPGTQATARKDKTVQLPDLFLCHIFTERWSNLSKQEYNSMTPPMSMSVQPLPCKHKWSFTLSHKFQISKIAANHQAAQMALIFLFATFLIPTLNK